MLMLLTVKVAVLPARSLAVPVTLWLAPSLLRGTGAVQVSMRERASPHRKVAVTFVLFQPLPLGAGAALPVMVGGVVSIFSWIVLPAAVLSSTFPALSTLQ